MTDIWLTSDTHFLHKRVIEFCRPQFTSVEEMNETLIENWNKVVKPGDKVYHLGDVYIGNPNFLKAIWLRLNGRKRLILGNHDDVDVLTPYFEKIMLWRRFDEHKLLLSHLPLHPSTLQEGRFSNGYVNVHGHTHEKGSPEGPYKSVCVELTDYTPVHIDQVLQ